MLFSVDFQLLIGRLEVFFQSFSGAMNINIFGYDYTETAATAIVEKVITAVNE